MPELVVPPELHRNAIGDPVAVVDAAVEMIDHMAHDIGVADLGDLDVLDVGCGIRFTQAFLDRGVPCKRYVGVDTFKPVIDFLDANVADPRFEYIHIDAHNERYNPTGQPLSTLTIPEIEGRRFDLICLFSVFTHLAPHDYVAMLQLLRRFVKPDGRLFYTLFVNERTETGLGYKDRLFAAMISSTDPAVKERFAQAARAGHNVPDFRDADPRQPMLVALYSRAYALQLIEGTGWNVVRVELPNAHMQHHVVCSPVP
jgi:SAM-dependent methyltransferase